MKAKNRVRLARALFFVALATVFSLLLSNTPERDAGAAPSPVVGQGSSYVALAMQEWTANAQTQGLKVNYLPTGSPQGLTAFGQTLADFAGTEAEFSALQAGTDPARGFQYVPDVAGAVAMMYNVLDTAGRKVDYLHLSRRTVARIFTGDITSWADPAIAADNQNALELPDQPITVVYRSGLSGTTALFYDFVANIAPDIFTPWAQRNQFPTNVRIIQLDTSPAFAPKTQGFQGSDQIAQFLASPSGVGSIGYDEFGYSKVYGAPAAWIENTAGQWVQPYTQNIAAALKSAQLRADLSQELSGVYNSGDPEAYPISAYSYLVTQCAPTGDRPTCKGPYNNSGVAETLAPWMRYVACDGQVSMAQIGYSPLPPNLSQEMANSIGRMLGTAPEQLNADNCANPTFRGSLGEGASSPEDPFKEAGILDGAGASSNASSNAAAAASGPTDEVAAAGRAGASLSAGGGSGERRKAEPVAYDRPGSATSALWPIVLLAVLIAGPPLVVGRRRRARTTRGE